ncbi:HAD family hydrolase [Xylophilus sp.]|uniref:HAD family hydrolase n=1 Tax=Xylophilus sp. TaxID=2653893 RepID=UPI0013B9C93D|nr:HAD-IA family hydrolase [Xylophilus sp.]KAF1045030.1 MAG: 5-amino-6-(5-phospho-D-ribitylamino)uracil phosphatase YigB [Xylophilus sp.]
MIDVSLIRGITLDLDDTLWPVWPAITRAEHMLRQWLGEHAPATAALYSSTTALREIREQVGRERQDLRHDLSELRREAIRRALAHAGEDPALAVPAFDVFFAERQRVELFEDVLPALDHLAARFPILALTNGNADVHRIGLGRYFRGTVSARDSGFGKPDARIFQAGAVALGLHASQVLHVGDDASLDALGALQAGMQTAWLNRGEHPWPHPDLPHAEVGDLLELCRLLK